MSQPFDAYAHYYDLLYRDKDYAAESEYIDSHIRKLMPGAKRILELGCGTGAHAVHLARMGYTVHGVDMSESMLARADARKSKLPPEVAARLSFGLGDVRTVRTGDTYDVVISLFHVMSYQATHADLNAAFATAATHLGKGGVFFFDFWYGPAVLAQQPGIRVKRLEDDNIRVTRIAEPVLHENENLVDVNYEIWVENKAGETRRVNEIHRMRYWFISELTLLLEQAGFESCGVEAWMSEQPLSVESWSAGMAARLR